MNLENIFSLLITGAGLILAIIAAYYIFKGLRYLLIKVLEGVGFVAKIFFKLLYLLLTVAISAVGLLGIGAFVESILQNKPLQWWALGIGLVLLYLGSRWFVNFIKNGFSFGEEKVSQSYYSPNLHSDSTDTDHKWWREEREMEELRAESQARWDAELEEKYKRQAQELEDWRADQAQKARENWEAKQKADEEFQRRQEEAEAYNKQVMEDWKRQAEEAEEYNRKVREERGW